ncbi:MAG: hypothetical protein AAFX79_11795 [Planctomycetota bacterium]
MPAAPTTTRPGTSRTALASTRLGTSLIAAVAGVAAATAVLGPVAMPALAQRAVRVQPRPEAVTIARMTTPITADFRDQRLEDVLEYLVQQTEADLEILWESDRATSGLDPDMLITLKVENLAALTVLERVLDMAQGEFGGLNNWQMTSWGAMQVGPTERLNNFVRTEIYDINDLLLTLPEYDEVPELELDQALQSGQGGGGGQSPFQNNNDQDLEELPIEERAREIIDLVEEFVEPEHWVENPRASIKYFRGNMIVRAPDYVHRGLVGYSYWPARRVTRVVEGRRYVTMSVDTGISTIDGIGTQPVSAVVGGSIISSGPPGGGG